MSATSWIIVGILIVSIVVANRMDRKQRQRNRQASLDLVFRENNRTGLVPYDQEKA